MLINPLDPQIHGQGGMQKFPSHHVQYEPTQFHQHEIFL
jgi:hypothetical protein